MERVALDVIGPLSKTIGGNRFILVICDYFTKWPEAYAVPDHKAGTVASKLVDEWVSRYGSCKRYTRIKDVTLRVKSSSH